MFKEGGCKLCDLMALSSCDLVTSLSSGGVVALSYHTFTDALSGIPAAATDGSVRFSRKKQHHHAPLFCVFVMQALFIHIFRGGLQATFRLWV